MSADNWAEVDRYIGDKLLHPGDPFAAFLKANAASGLPAIDVSPAQGKFLHLLARIAGARRILEIGTLGGYSTAWLASALPDGGKLTTLEHAVHHAEVAKANLSSAGLADRVEIRTGAALDTLPKLTGSFDLIFIDADKPNNTNYLRWALKLAREGTVVVLDNAIRHGAVIDSRSSDAGIRGSREAFDLLANEPRFDSTALQTVGLKGWDGFVLARVKAP
jgi:predicted O-methyltransferase YrrM